MKLLAFVVSMNIQNEKKGPIMKIMNQFCLHANRMMQFMGLNYIIKSEDGFYSSHFIYI